MNLIAWFIKETDKHTFEDKDETMRKKTKKAKGGGVGLTFEQCGQIVIGNILHHDELFVGTLGEEIRDERDQVTMFKSTEGLDLGYRLLALVTN